MKKLPSGVALEIFDTLDSTSAEAKRRVHDGVLAPAWILALHQTAGYGRRGRRWEQETGDFAGTLFFKPDAPAERWGQLSFVTALALASALDRFLSEDLVTLKWPNDVLIDGGKCAGILLENLGACLSIGIGVNMVTAPDDVSYAVARLVDHVSPPPGPGAFVMSLDVHFWSYYQQWLSDGFVPIRDAWLSRVAGLGSKVTVRLPNQELEGVFEGIDETGGLILRLSSGTRTIAAGDVFFGPRRQG